MHGPKRLKSQFHSKLGILLDLPVLASDTSTIELSENGRARISRCYAIAKYSESFIELILKSTIATIQGDHLILCAFANGSVEIRGNIYTLQVLPKEVNER